MNHFHALAVLVLAAAPAFAQSQPPSLNLYGLYPDYINPQNCTQFSSRSDLVGNAGEIVQGGLGQHAWYVGDYTSGGSNQGYLWTFHARMQDQNPTTRDNFRWILRKADATGNSPDATAAGVVYVSQSFPGRQVTGAFDISFALGSPISYQANRPHWYGVELGAAPWPADGLSIWFAHDRLGTLGDNPRADAPPTSFDIHTGRAKLPTELGAFRMCVTTSSPTLHTGARNPANTRQVPTGAVNYGRGGVYPDVDGYNGSGRADDLAVELRVNPNSGGVAVLALALNTVAPLPLNTIGAIRVPANSLLTPAVAIPATGRVEVVLPLGPAGSYTRRFLASNDLLVQAVAGTANGQLHCSNVAKWYTKTTR